MMEVLGSLPVMAILLFAAYVLERRYPETPLRSGMPAVEPIDEPTVSYRDDEIDEHGYIIDAVKCGPNSYAVY